MSNTLKFGNGEWYGKKDAILAYNDENNNYKPLPFTFDRASSATRVNKDGLIETVGADQPRVDFLNDSKGALKLEPSRTNLLTYSEELSNWTNIQNVTVTDKDIISPNGSQNASRINETAVNGVHRLFLNPTVASAKHTFSVFLKAGTRKWAYLRLDGGTFEPRTWFDLENGVLGTVNSDHIASIEDFGNGWYRCSVTIAGTTYDTTPLGIIAITTGNNVYSYAGDVNEYIYAWSAQLEQGSYATSIINTSGSAVTRVADVCNNAGNDQVFNDNEGVLYVETKGFTDLLTQSNYIQLSKNGELSATNSLIIQHRNNGYLRVYVNGFGTPDIHFNINIDFTQNHKIAVLYKLNGYKLFIDGVEQNLYLTPTQAVFIGLDNLSFDLRGALSWNGSIKDVRVYNTALTDAELQALTT